jgi:hypothetical protein
MTTPGQPIPPKTSEMAASWRAACIAYRRVREAGKLHDPAYHEAVAASREARPELTEREAAGQTVEAIYYAPYAHPEWLWRAAGCGGGLSHHEFVSGAISSLDCLYIRLARLHRVHDLRPMPAKTMVGSIYRPAIGRGNRHH